jgi:hypothetical protein
MDGRPDGYIQDVRIERTAREHPHDHCVITIGPGGPCAASEQGGEGYDYDGSKAEPHWVIHAIQRLLSILEPAFVAEPVAPQIQAEAGSKSETDLRLPEYRFTT